MDEHTLHRPSNCLAASVLAGYRLDNSSRLVAGTPGTLSAFALNLSSYDRAEAGVSLQVPLRVLAPLAELVVESPVARGGPPLRERPLRARLALGLSQVQTGVPGLTAPAAFQLSLSRAGRVDELSLPTPGFAPDAPWTVLAGLTWAFERPALPGRAREVPWHELRAAQAPTGPGPTTVQVTRPREKAVLRVLVTDAKTDLPIAGAWVSFVEGSDVGSTTGPEGRARLEAEPGNATLAVARDGYELVTEPIVLAAGAEKQLAVALTPVAPDGWIRGRLVGEDGAPLRAALTALLSGTLPSLPGTGGAQPEVFEGAYTFALQHGVYELVATTPGYRASVQHLELRPGETLSRDLVLRRVAGEARARLGPLGAELSEPLRFTPAQASLGAASGPLLDELALALLLEQRTLEVIARVDLAELTDEAEALRLSDARANAVIDALRTRGVRDGLLKPRGAGLARVGQPIVELRALAAQKPRSQLRPVQHESPHAHAAVASSGGLP